MCLPIRVYCREVAYESLGSFDNIVKDDISSRRRSGEHDGRGVHMNRLKQVQVESQERPYQNRATTILTAFSRSKR